jgi:opacity protein-like surface antigen
MRFFVVTAAAVALAAASAAYAQDVPAQSGPQNPAVKSTDQNNSTAPVAGANSFTMGEAKSQLEAKGYTQVRQLKKDPNGVWRGMAMKDGQTVPVSVDYQGNVN